MRRLSAASVILLVSACSGGASPPNTTGATTTSTSSEAAPADDTSGVCSEYIACVAKKAPEMLDTVADAYGKSGSCWSEMSTAACENACIAGKAKAKCDVCDLSLGSCLGESCAPRKKCPFGEVCAKGKCIEEVRKTCGASSESNPECPAPYECAGAGDGYACLLPCVTDTDCPALSTCSAASGYCWM